jgi:dihydropteroate synthase
MERKFHRGQTKLQWYCRQQVFSFSNKPLIMGILNVTPDSFSDGGKYLKKEAAIARALEMLEEGADIIDVGGESSRPGSLPVPEEEEAARVLPVIEAISHKIKGAVISIDTRKSGIARRALEAGSHIINDISALRSDAKMLDIAREYSAGIILMHMKGEPATMQIDPVYKDLFKEIKEFFTGRLDFCIKNGIKKETLAIDPGIGFGKTTSHNLRLIANIDQFTDLNVPVVMGLSRKRFIGELTDRAEDERVYGTIAANIFACLKGVNIIRVHDVKAASEAIKVFCALMKELD